MQIPKELKDAIEKELSCYSVSSLKRASQELTASYHNSENTQKISSYEQKLAYLAARMPATFAAISRVLRELEGLSIETLLDLGSGPGTLWWAFSEQFPTPIATLIEKDGDFIRLGKSLLPPSHTSIQWVQADLVKESHFSPSDLVTLSYSLGEIPKTKQLTVLSKAWESTKKALVLIEPGTPKGFELIRDARKELIQQGASLLAPCPHQDACPISGSDWCHFSQRLERVSFHRTVKDVSMSYEDEKFSYIIASKEPVRAAGDRILRHPLKRSGHIQFTVCSRSGAKQLRVVSRKNKEEYIKAKKLEWGDILE